MVVVLLAHIILVSLLGQAASNPWKFIRPEAGITKTIFKRSNAMPLLDPPPGQRCSGRNYQGRRCCTPENPCDEGEGDCDGPGDGGGHDGHKGCKGDLQCGSNNCRKFGLYFHEKDDCCEKPSAISSQPEVFIPGAPLEPKEGQRCKGRNYGSGRRCCTPDEPCDEGEGDCDGPEDGGQHDGHDGCKGSLVCGTNNCKKFGAYYHEKDDCCEKPSSPIIILPTTNTEEFPVSKRCRGRHFDKEGCCSIFSPCVEGEGDCEDDSDCNEGLVCGNNNCKAFGSFFHAKDDCCVKPETPSIKETQTGPRCRGRNVDGRGSGCCSPNTPCVEGEGDCEQDSDCNGNLVCGNNNCKVFGSFFHAKDDCCVKPVTTVETVTKSVFPLTEPPPGQKCSGRNYQGRRCCTPENPCDEGEGDCDGPGDGGGHDGHKGCKGDLQCGSNNCQKFGLYFHEKDDCCEKPTAASSHQEPEPAFLPGTPLEPPAGQRCSGRNYGGRRCCTPENPCDEGEGDCDGPGDGGGHDGHKGCKGDLMCGSNNCLKFGAYFHAKDDCCEKPPQAQELGGWGDWAAWSQCSKSCGVGQWSRTRDCTGNTCRHKHQSQQRFCNTQPCQPRV